MLLMVTTLIAALTLCCFPVFCESISGKLIDPDGNFVSGVRLLLIEGNGTRATTLTDESGHYSFKDVAPGTYLILIRELGLRQYGQEFRLESGQDLEHDFALKMELLREEVLVTATRTEAHTSSLGSSVTVISADEIEAQNATNVAELLRNSPSVNILQYGAAGSLTSIFVRGGESDYNKVLLDGVPLNQPGGSVDLSSLSTANVERIEIVRGPQSALYGSDAITSVIQIFTKKGAAETSIPAGSVFLEGGTFDTFRGGATIAGQHDRVSYSAAFQHFRTDNGGPNDFFRNNSYSSNIGITISANSSLNFVGRAERGRSGAPGPTALGPPDLEEFYRKRDLVLGLAWNHRISDSWQQKVSYSHSYINQLSEDPEFSHPFDFPFSFLSATRRHNTNYQSDFLIHSHQLSTGFEYEEQQGVVGDVRKRRTNLGYYVQDQFLLTHRLAITGGLRLEDNGSFGFAATPRVSLSFLAKRGQEGEFWGMTRPKFHFGLGIKEPNFIESFSPNFFFRGNPDLKPERTRSIEAGVEQTLASDRVRAEVNFFHNRFDDLIAFEIVDLNTFEGSFFNIIESQAWGVENVFHILPREDLRFFAGYTYLHSTIVNSSPFDPVFREGGRLPLRPTHSGFAGLTFLSDKWTVSTRATFVGNRADSDFRTELTEVDGYTRWDLSGSYRLNHNLELVATFENLLNQEYFEKIGFPALKFHFRSGLRFRF